jgi:hypothetical protein
VSRHSDPERRTEVARLEALAALTARLGRSADLDELLTVSLEALDELFGFDHSMLLMLDETGTSLYTIASRGYDRAGIGSEVEVGAGLIGMAAAQGRTLRVGNVGRMIAYARIARQAAHPEDDGTEIPLPGLSSVASQMVAPAIVMGRTVGVLAVESELLGAFTADDERVLTAVAHLLANAIELDRVRAAAVPPPAAPRQVPRPEVPPTPERACTVRFFAVDGSTFVDGEYVIKGVAGRILWRLLTEYQEQRRTDFTNREVRLDPSLHLPAYHDNLESRLVLLQRRLEERQMPIRLSKMGRGKFRLCVEGAVQLDGHLGP